MIGCRRRRRGGFWIRRGIWRMRMGSWMGVGVGVMVAVVVGVGVMVKGDRGG
jgi:hypothetical protein